MDRILTISDLIDIGELDRVNRYQNEVKEDLNSLSKALYYFDIKLPEVEE